MSRVAFVNGRYRAHAQACVHIEDRGYQFADGVYEVCQIRSKQIVDLRRHLDRLERSLSELRIAMPMQRASLEIVLKEVVRRNRVADGLVYLQITRGVARRDHVFPDPAPPPAVVVTCRSVAPGGAAAKAESGVSVITVPENRWPRVDIKSVALLPNVLARQQAKEAGRAEAWYFDSEGMVTEGAATNAWIVTRDGHLVTRPAEFGILRGITRAVVMEVAQHQGLTVEERPFSVDEATSARECFMTSASNMVTPIVRVDERAIGNGRPGSIALALRQAFFDFAELEDV
jgi:D-alanine transaminase